MLLGSARKLYKRKRIRGLTKRKTGRGIQRTRLHTLIKITVKMAVNVKQKTGEKAYMDKGKRLNDANFFCMDKTKTRSPQETGDKDCKKVVRRKPFTKRGMSLQGKDCTGGLSPNKRKEGTQEGGKGIPQRENNKLCCPRKRTVKMRL